MGLSNAAVTPGNLQLGICRVKFDGVDLGATLDSVLVKPVLTKAEKKADQYGDTVLDRVVSKMECTVEMSLAETVAKSIWKVAFPHAALVGTSPKQVTFKNSIGDSDLVLAKELKLHPLYAVDGDLNEDHTFFKALCAEASEFKLSPTEQSRLKCVFNVYLDFTKDPVAYYVHGNPAIGLTPASAGSPVLSGAGNGTMSPVAAYSGYTVSENIVATCIKEELDGGLFEVIGSVSGAQGVARVGTPFVAKDNVISFTINDGSADFEEDDAFTVAMTAANYQ